MAASAAELIFKIRGDSTDLQKDFTSAQSTIQTSVGRITQTATQGFGQVNTAINGTTNALNQIATAGGANLGALTGSISRVASAFTGAINPATLFTAGLGAVLTIGIEVANAQEKLIKETIEFGSRMNDLSIKTG